jgi:hypothetical protein
MPKYTFLAICYEYSVVPDIALENEKVRAAVLAADVVTLASVLNSEF